MDTKLERFLPKTEDSTMAEIKSLYPKNGGAEVAMDFT